MRRLGLQGARRGKVVRTTVSDKATPCPLDRVNRQFKADRPNQLWVSDFTYVSTWQGWLYVAFVIDVFARRIVGWRVSSSMHTDFVLDALEQALYARQPERRALVHHSDRGSQYVSIRYSERLAEAGIEPSVGSKGDSYGNALAETINGLYKTELIHRRAPWKTKAAVELATLEWVSWFNHHRLLEPGPRHSDDIISKVIFRKRKTFTIHGLMQWSCEPAGNRVYSRLLGVRNDQDEGGKPGMLFG